MRLLITDTFVTQTYALPIASGWIAAPDGITLELMERLDAHDVTEQDAALIPSSELLALRGSHDVLADIAVIAGGAGAIAMRTPVRPDEIEATPVRLLDTSGVAELLARATLQPFYGIVATSWVRQDDSPEAARAQVVIVEGAEALRDPEGGFSEDLCRAWFILTAQPVVTHVLLAPHSLAPSRLGEVVGFLDDARSAALARRREWRSRLADDASVARDRASALWTAQRLKLEEADRLALLDLLGKGIRETSGSLTANVEFIEGAGTG